MIKDRTPVLNFVRNVFLVIILLLVAIPFLWMLITSLQPDSRAVLTRPFKFPWPPQFHNYLAAWRAEPFDIYARNSIIIAVAATGLQLTSAILAAYAFACLKFPFKQPLFLLILAVLMMPSQVAIIPLYSTMCTLGWLDTFAGLIVPFAVDAYGIFLLRQHFMAIPKDYAEAAKIEGAGHLRIAFQVMASMTTPTLIAYAIMAFKWRWNDYFWVLLMTSSIEKRTLPVGIVMMKDVADGGTQWHLLMAATVIVLLPMIVMYLALQKYFTDGYMKGGLKG